MSDNARYILELNRIFVGNGAFRSTREFLIFSILHELTHFFQKQLGPYDTEHSGTLELQTHDYVLEKFESNIVEKQNNLEQVVKDYKDAPKEKKDDIYKKYQTISRSVDNAIVDRNLAKNLRNTQEELIMNNLDEWLMTFPQRDEYLKRKKSQKPKKNLLQTQSLIYPLDGSLRLGQPLKSRLLLEEQNLNEGESRMSMGVGANSVQNQQVLSSPQPSKAIKAAVNDAGLNIGKQFEEVLGEAAQTKVVDRIKKTAGEIGPVILGIGQLAKSALSNFGEIGEQIGKLVGDAADTVAGIASKLATGDWFGAFVQGAVAYWQTMGELIVDNFQYADINKAIDDATKELREKNHEAEVAIAEDRMKIRKKNGEDVLQDELKVIKDKADIEKKKINEQYDEQKKNVHTGLAGTIRSWFGLNSPVEQAKLNEIEKQRQLAISQVDLSSDQDAEQARKDEFHRREQVRTDAENRADAAKLAAAKRSGDKLVMIEAETQSSKLAIQHKYEQLFTEATEKGIQDQSDLVNAFLDEIASATAEGEQKKRDIKAEADVAVHKANFDHQEAEINLMQEGSEKQLKLLEINKQRRLQEIDDEMGRYEQNSPEWKRLAQQRADAEKTADKQIKDSMDETAEKRKQKIEDLRDESANLAAQLTEDGMDDIFAGKQTSLDQLKREREAERKQVIADHGNDLEMLAAVDQKYELKRTGILKQSEKQIIEEVKKQRTAVYEADTKALQASIDLEQKRLKEIEKQNKAIQEGIDKKEKERKQALSQFDAEDRGVFASLVQNADYASALQEGLKEIANPEGTAEQTASTQTKQDAIKEYISELELQNENRYKLEEISQGDYLGQKQTIAGLQARAAEEALKDTSLTSRQRLDLEQMKADAYVSFQEAYRQVINSRFDTEVQRMQESIDANNAYAATIQAGIDKQQEQMDALKTAYDKDLAAIDANVGSIINSNAQWQASVEGLKEGLKQPIQEIIDMYNKASDAARGLGNTKPSQGAGGSSSSSSNAFEQYIPTILHRDDTQGFIYQGANGQWYKSAADRSAAEAKKMAAGGLVPQGYPNDSFPALLTSGETVLPVWLTNLLATAYRSVPGLSNLVDNSRKIEINLQGIFNEPGAVRKEIMQALQQANYTGAGVNGTYYMSTGLN